MLFLLWSNCFNCMTHLGLLHPSGLKPRLVAVDYLLSGNRLRQELPWSASNDLARIEVENLAVETQAVTRLSSLTGSGYYIRNSSQISTKKCNIYFIKSIYLEDMLHSMVVSSGREKRDERDGAKISRTRRPALTAY